MIERPAVYYIPGELVIWAILACALTPLMTSVVHDAQQRRWGWLFLDLLLPPVGIVRGIGIWFRLIPRSDGDPSQRQ